MVVVKVVYLDNMRVAQTGHGRGFLLKAAHKLGVVGQMGMDEFNGHLPAQIWV